MADQNPMAGPRVVPVDLPPAQTGILRDELLDWLAGIEHDLARFPGGLKDSQATVRDADRGIPRRPPRAARPARLMDPSAEFVAAIVGPRIRRIRRAQELSQEALADFAEIHRTQISLIEYGGRLPRIDTMIRLAGGLLVPPCELVDGILGDPRGHRPGRMVVVDRGADG